MRTPDAQPTLTDRPAGTRSTWRALLEVSGIANIVVFLAVAALLTDLEAAAYAGGFAVGLGLMRVRTGRLGVVVLGLLSFNVLGWTSLAVVSNLRGGQTLLAVAIPAGLASLALITVVAAGMELARRSRPGGSIVAARAVATVAALVFLGLMGAGVRSATDVPAEAEDALVVVADNVLFAPTELAAAAGEVTVRLRNEDLFWHTFTIDELAVDLPVAVHGDRAVTFAAPAGTYDFYCRIPGHEARMRGTIVVVG